MPSTADSIPKALDPVSDPEPNPRTKPLMHCLGLLQAAQEVRRHLLQAAERLTVGCGWSAAQSDSPTDSDRLSRLLEATRQLAAVSIPSC